MLKKYNNGVSFLTGLNHSILKMQRWVMSLLANLIEIVHNSLIYTITYNSIL